MAALPEQAARRLESAREIAGVHVNLLPTTHRVKVHRLPRVTRGKLITFAVLCAVIGGVGGLTYLQEQSIRATRAHVEALTAERAALMSQQEVVAALRARRADLQSRLTTIEALSRNRHRAADEADALPRTLPERLWLTEATFTDSMRATISGVALSPLTVADLVARLDSTETFRNAKLVVAEAGVIDKIPVTRFTVRAGLAR